MLKADHTAEDGKNQRINGGSGGLTIIFNRCVSGEMQCTRKMYTCSSIYMFGGWRLEEQTTWLNMKYGVFDWLFHGCVQGDKDPCHEHLVELGCVREEGWRFTSFILLSQNYLSCSRNVTLSYVNSCRMASITTLTFAVIILLHTYRRMLAYHIYNIYTIIIIICM